MMISLLVQGQKVQTNTQQSKKKATKLQQQFQV